MTAQYEEYIVTKRVTIEYTAPLPRPFDPPEEEDQEPEEEREEEEEGSEEEEEGPEEFAPRPPRRARRRRRVLPGPPVLQTKEGIFALIVKLNKKFYNTTTNNVPFHRVMGFEGTYNSYITNHPNITVVVCQNHNEAEHWGIVRKVTVRLLPERGNGVEPWGAIRNETLFCSTSLTENAMRLELIAFQFSPDNGTTIYRAEPSSISIMKPPKKRGEKVR